MELLFDRMGAQGDAIARTPTGSVFAPLVLPGERVEGEIEGERFAVSRILDPSPERRTPDCIHFGRCGGCLLQHWEAAPALAWKRDLVVEALAREGIATQVAATVDAHGSGRRRAIFHARQYGARTVVGFAERRSHAMVAIDACPVLAPALAGALSAARAMAEALAPLRKPLDLQVTATDAGLDMDVRGSGPLPPALFTDLAALAERHGLARLTRHGEMVIQRAAPFVMMGTARVEIPPASFLQATAEGEARLAALVDAATLGARRIADLFAGSGTFALRLATRARIAAYESNAPALAALVKGARTPGLKPVEGEARDLFRRPLVAMELKAFDAVVMDPPRQGAEAQAAELAQAKGLATLAYVSCSAKTFARDARLLMAGGFRLEAVTPVDQFRYSPHVELVGVFRR